MLRRLTSTRTASPPPVSTTNSRGVTAVTRPLTCHISSAGGFGTTGSAAGGAVTGGMGAGRGATACCGSDEGAAAVSAGAGGGGVATLSAESPAPTTTAPIS